MSDERKGPVTEMKVDGGNQGYAKPMDRYADPKSSKPGKPVEVPAEIQPFDNRQLLASTMIVALEGGQLDGELAEVRRACSSHQAVVKVDPATIEPFVFDAEARRRGEHSVVRGEYDTVTYKRTARTNPDGLTIFAKA